MNFFEKLIALYESNKLIKLDIIGKKGDIKKTISQLGIIN